MVILVRLLLALLHHLLCKLLEALVLAVIEHLDDRLHGYRGEELVHIHLDVELPVLLRGDGLDALLVLVYLGALGLTHKHHIACIPLAVGVHILNNANHNVARGDILEGVVAWCHIKYLLLHLALRICQLQDVVRFRVRTLNLDVYDGVLRGV